MITGMDRLAAAIKGESSDRIPVFCNLLDQGAAQMRMPLQEYYSRGEYVAEAQLTMREKYGHDNVWSLFYVGKEAEVLGCRKIKFAEDGPPNVEDFVIKTWDDVDKLDIPKDLAAHPALQESMKCTAILKREVGGKYPICAYITATMALPAILMGMEKWMELLFLGPSEVCRQLLAKCHEFFVKETAAYRDAGADVIVYSNPFGSTDIVSRKFFLEQSLPWIEKDVKAIGPTGVVYYCGTACLTDVIDTIITRTGLSVFYLSPLENPADAKREVAGRGLTCGIINDIRLVDWTPDEVQRDVKRILDAGMPGGRFLFGTGVMPYAIPEENIRAMVEAAYVFGQPG